MNEPQGAPTQPGLPPEHTPEHPIVQFTDRDLALLLRRAARVTALLGLAMGWANGALLAESGNGIQLFLAQREQSALKL